MHFRRRTVVLPFILPWVLVFLLVVKGLAGRLAERAVPVGSAQLGFGVFNEALRCFFHFSFLLSRNRTAFSMLLYSMRRLFQKPRLFTHRRKNEDGCIFVGNK